MAAETAERVCTVDIAPGVVEVSMSGPPGNPLDLDLVACLVDCLTGLDQDPACRAALLTSTDRHFCAGATGKLAGGAATWSVEQLYAQVPQLAGFGKPLIAVMRGAAVGGGLGLALLADFRYAASDARFQANFTLLGYHPGFGISRTLPDLVGRQAALDMLLTGRRVGAAEAAAIGLCDAVAAPEEIRAAALAKAAEFAAAAPLAVRAVKATARADLLACLPSVLADELAQQRELKQTTDYAEGVQAACARRTPVFHGR